MLRRHNLKPFLSFLTNKENWRYNNIINWQTKVKGLNPKNVKKSSNKLNVKSPLYLTQPLYTERNKENKFIVKLNKRSIATLSKTYAIAPFKRKKADIFPINPVTDPLLFSSKYLGSLYSITSITTLSILNPYSKLKAIIKIVEVIDLAIDRSGVQRKYGDKAIVYLWTHKGTGQSYVGSSLNVKGRFGSAYNSPLYLKRAATPFNTALLLYGHAEFYITILAVLPPYKSVVWPQETLWRAILKPTYNRAIISGTTAGIFATPADLEIRKQRPNNLGEKLGAKLIGDLNPFYGKNHSQASKDSISATKGEKIYVYLVNKDKSLTPILPPFPSGNSAAKALGVSRTTIRKFAFSGLPYTIKKEGGGATYLFSFSNLLDT